MKYNVKNITNEYDFYIEGASYAGNPRNNTMMYISNKVKYLVDKLVDKQECLVFLETGIEVPDELKKNNCFVFSDNPQLSYAQFAIKFANEQRKQEIEWGYTLTDKGYYVGHNVSIGKNVYIEPNVLIGHNVTIGDNAVILYGSVIKNTSIGHDFLCNENASIGTNGFTMANGHDKIRIPSLGHVVIGNHVEIGAHDNISRGSAGDTRICDNVKLDALVYIGHDAVIKDNSEIVAGSVVGGYDIIGENSFVGFNASLRNRLNIGNNTIIGMGSVVTKSIYDNITVVGNPARQLKLK